MQNMVFPWQSKHISFVNGSFLNVKLPMDCLFIYFCYNTFHIIVPTLTRCQGKAESKEIERETRHKEMIVEDHEKQDKTRQLAAISVDTKQKTSYILWGNQTKNHQEHLQVDKQREKTNKQTKKTTNSNNTSSKYIEHNCGYGWFETTGRHSNCMISM